MTITIKFVKYLPKLVNEVEKDKVGSSEYKSVKKMEIKCLQFQLTQKIEICLNLDLKICLSLNKFKVLVLQRNQTF